MRLIVKCALLILMGFQVGWSQKVPENKQTKLGLYLTAQQAFQRWQMHPDKIKILDVRTPQEYVYVGHAPMAINVPWLFTENHFDPVKSQLVTKKNADFVTKVMVKFAPTDTLFVMCRSGGRSTAAVNALAEAGFLHVFNILDGFEGDPITDENSYLKGKRLVNGWKNANAPWTYDLDSKLIY